MKIAVLMGSPRKRDSYSICEEMAEAMNGAEFDYIYLKDYRIEACKGCDLCFKKSETLCPCKDDLELIKEKLLAADGVILAAPVYAYQVPGTFKILIDRLSYWFHRQEMVGKPAAYVVTSGGGGHKEVAKYLKMTASGWGLQMVGGVCIVSPFYFKSTETESVLAFNEKYYQTQSQAVNKLADQLSHAITNTSPYVPSYYDLFLFNGLRTKTVTSAADYAFWKQRGWLESDYFYEVKLSLGKRLFGKLMKGLIDWQVERVTGKRETQGTIL